MRATLPAACLALCVSAPPVLCAETSDPVAAWLATLERGAWTARGFATDAVLFVRPATPNGGFRRLWVRYELLDPERSERGFSYLSRVTLSEFDCSARRGRALETTWYAGNNMAAPSQRSTTATPWQQPEAGTLFVEELQQACS
jgi:hypothetical protein